MRMLAAAGEGSGGKGNRLDEQTTFPFGQRADNVHAISLAENSGQMVDICTLFVYAPTTGSSMCIQGGSIDVIMNMISSLYKLLFNE